MSKSQAQKRNNALRRFVWRRPLASFYALTIVLVMLVMGAGLWRMLVDPAAANMLPGLFEYVEQHQTYVNILSIAGYAVNVEANAVFILAFAVGPSMAAVIIAGTNGNLRNLGSRLRPWRGVPWRRGVAVYGVLVLVHLAVASTYLWLTNVIVGPTALAQQREVLGDAWPLVVGALVLAMLVDEGGTLEELGWRGFALPQLLGWSKTPLRASVAMGLLWWAWHLPRELLAFFGDFDAASFLYAQTVFASLCIAQSIVITLAFNLTGGSVWVAVLIHGGSNVWGKALGAALNETLGFDVRTLIIVAAAAVILAATKARLGTQRGGAP